MSTPRSRNSRMTSAIASSEGVARTTPRLPMMRSMRVTRPARSRRVPRACGLTMTPIPGTSGGRPGPGELSAGGLDVLAPALAHRGAHPMAMQMGAELLGAPARARGEGGARKRIERNQVHLGTQAVQQRDQPLGIG